MWLLLPIYLTAVFYPNYLERSATIILNFTKLNFPYLLYIYTNQLHITFITSNHLFFVFLFPFPFMYIHFLYTNLSAFSFFLLKTRPSHLNVDTHSHFIYKYYTYLSYTLSFILFCYLYSLHSSILAFLSLLHTYSLFYLLIYCLIFWPIYYWKPY